MNEDFEDLEGIVIADDTFRRSGYKCIGYCSIIMVTLIIVNIIVPSLELLWLLAIFGFIGVVSFFYAVSYREGKPYFIISIEKIEVFLPEMVRSYWRLEPPEFKLDFEIKWSEFDTIQIKEGVFGYDLHFIGKDTNKGYSMDNFHEIKQQEILLVLETYAKKQKKDFIYI